MLRAAPHDKKKDQSYFLFGLSETDLQPAGVSLGRPHQAARHAAIASRNVRPAEPRQARQPRDLLPWPADRMSTVVRALIGPRPRSEKCATPATATSSPSTTVSQFTVGQRRDLPESARQREVRAARAARRQRRGRRRRKRIIAARPPAELVETRWTRPPAPGDDRAAEASSSQRRRAGHGTSARRIVRRGCRFFSRPKPSRRAKRPFATPATALSAAVSSGEREPAERSRAKRSGTQFKDAGQGCAWRSPIARSPTRPTRPSTTSGSKVFMSDTHRRLRGLRICCLPRLSDRADEGRAVAACAPAHVNQSALAIKKHARWISARSLMRLGEGERKSGGARDKESLLAATLTKRWSRRFIFDGSDAAFAFARREFVPRPKCRTLVASDPKTELQTPYAKKDRGALPVYRDRRRRLAPSTRRSFALSSVRLAASWKGAAKASRRKPRSKRRRAPRRGL